VQVYFSQALLDSFPKESQEPVPPKVLKNRLKSRANRAARAMRKSAIWQFGERAVIDANRTILEQQQAAADLQPPEDNSGQ
jgi:hypothetical protein